MECIQVAKHFTAGILAIFVSLSTWFKYINAARSAQWENCSRKFKELVASSETTAFGELPHVSPTLQFL